MQMAMLMAAHLVHCLVIGDADYSLLSVLFRACSCSLASFCSGVSSSRTRFCLSFLARLVCHDDTTDYAARSFGVLLAL